MARRRQRRREKLNKLDAASIPASPEQVTVEAFLTQWIDGAKISPTTRARYEQLNRLHIIPHIGHLPVSKLVTVTSSSC